MADFKLEADETRVIAALDAIEKKLTQVGVKADETGKKIGEGLSGSEADAKRAAESLAQYTAAQDKLRAGAQDRIAQNGKMKAGLEQFRKEQEALNKATDDGAKKNIEFGAALKDTASGLNAGANAAKSAEGATKGATVAQRIWNTVMSANPIGLVIAAIALLVNQLRKYQGVIDFASKITSQIGAVFTVVTDRAISLGKAIYSLVTLDFAGFGQNATAAVTGFSDAVSNAWTQAGNLADATTRLRDAQLEAALSTAKLQAASDRAQASAQDETKNFNQRIELLKKAIGLEAEIARIKTGFAAQDLVNAQNEFALSNKNVAAREALLEKELAFNAAQNDAAKTRIALLQQLNGLEKERLNFIAKAIEDAQKLSDKLDVSLAEDPVDKKIIQINQGVTAQVEAIQKGIDRINEVQKLRPLDESELALRQNLQDKIVAVIDQGQDEIIKSILDGARKEQEAQDKIDKAKADVDKKRGEDARKALKDVLDLENAKIDITEAEFKNVIATLKAQGADEASIKTAQLEFAKRITAERLQVELEYNKAILGQTKDGTEADILRARIQEIQTLLDGIDIPAPKGKDGKPRDLFDLLGIKLGDDQKDAFRESVALILDGLSQLADAHLKEAEAKAEAAQDKVDAAQEALDKELDIAKLGQANFVDLRKKELDEAKKLRDAAYKEEAKAKKQQIALDSIGQVSSLITASAQTLAKFNGPLLPIGIILVAAMFAAFAAAKAKALKAAEAPKLRKGKKFDGPTHEQGNEEMVFDGKRAYKVERDEWLIGTEPSREHDTFLGNLNQGKYKGVDLAGMADRRGGARSDYQSPISESAARTTALQGRRDRATETMHYNALSKTYEKVGADIVEAINKKPLVLPWKSGYKLVKETGHGTDTTTVLPSE